MITGSVVLDLRADSESGDRRALGALAAVPAGSRVIVDVGTRTFAPPSTVDRLRQYVDRLHFDVHGTADAVVIWVRELRVAADEWSLR
jgi:hypothetical protein